MRIKLSQLKNIPNGGTFYFRSVFFGECGIFRKLNSLLANGTVSIARIRRDNPQKLQGRSLQVSGECIVAQKII